MKVLLSTLALTTATQVMTGIGQYISLGLELSRCCACNTRVKSCMRNLVTTHVAHVTHVTLSLHQCKAIF